jgi:hypothetical protein
MARSQTPLERFVDALHHQNVDEVRQLLASYPEVRAAINEPISYFESRPVARATKNLPLLDVLLEYGADLNLKSAWWAGGFGLLEHGITPAEAAPLIVRGAQVDVFAAAHLGMFDRLRDLIERDPSLVHARGGDGKTSLHCATTVEIARYLLEKGAEIEARDVDHESTPAQYLVRDAPDVTRLLIDRGAWFDIFIAVGLRDHQLGERCLRDDAGSLSYRTWHGKYTVAHDGKRPATKAEIGDRRGDIYRWVFGHNMTAIDVARDLGDHDLERLLLSHATPAQRLLAACSGADHAVAEAIVAGYPGIVATISPDVQRLIADKAHANETAAVALMLDLGFDPLARSVDNWEPIRWAAFHGNAEMTRRLLAYSPPINVPDPRYGGTLLGACIYGSLHGWHRKTGDFATTAKLLIEAGERVEPSRLPTGRGDLDAVLKKYLA